METHSSVSDGGVGGRLLGKGGDRGENCYCGTVWGEGVGRLSVQVVRGEAFTGIFVTYYCHLLFQNCRFS